MQSNNSAIQHGQPANCWRFPRRLKKSRSLQARPSKAKCEVPRPSQERKENHVSQTASSIKQQKYEAGAARVDLKLEVEVVAVSDVDRAKEFYQRLGWRLDADDVAGADLRIVQFTPPGSGCSITFGKGITAAVPGSLRG